MHVPMIRPATEIDLQRLVDVEVVAGQLFHTVGMSIVAADVPQVADLREAVAAERIWVTCVGAEVAGYIGTEVVDGNAHVAQVSVAPGYAGRGIGKVMMEFVEAWGRCAGCPATTLTTFRDVPWNAPYYTRLGYEVLADNQIGPELARTIEYEASLPGICVPPLRGDQTERFASNRHRLTSRRHGHSPTRPPPAMPQTVRSNSPMSLIRKTVPVAPRHQHKDGGEAVSTSRCS